MQLTEFQFNEILALSTLSLATASQEGILHATPVYFVAMQPPFAANSGGNVTPFHLYFFSEPDSRQSHDIAFTGWAAGAVYPDTQDWSEILGLQIRGKVRQVSKELEWEAAFQGYQQKFPFFRTLKEKIAKNALYCFTPTWMRMLDNRRGFGFKQEWSYPDVDA